MADAELWEVVGDQASGLGARWAMRLRVGSAPVGGLVEITEFDAPANLAFNGITGVATRGRWRLRERVPAHRRGIPARLPVTRRAARAWSPTGLGAAGRRILKRSLRNLRDLVEGPG